MQVGVSLIIRGNYATQQNRTTMATPAEAWGFDSVWASDRLSIVQHLVLDFVLETIDNALATMDRFVHDVRPALG